MRNYVIINGVNSLTIQGLAIKTLPPITKPIQRNLREEIDGRDGDIVTTLGYGAYDKTIEIGLFGTFDIDEVIAYFNQKGTITFSNEADKVYYFEALDQVDYAELLKFRTANVVLHCQPFKYPVTETPLEEEYEYVTGTGTNITLDNTSEAIFNKIDLLGNTEQTQYTGKNLLPNTLVTQTYRGLTFTHNQDGSITINGTSTAGGQVNICNAGEMSLQAGNYIMSSKNIIPSQTWLTIRDNNRDLTSITNLSQKQITIEANTTTAYVYFYFNNGVTINNLTIFPMISTNGGDYEPYVGGVPSPNPNYPQDIHVVSGDNTITITGRNLMPTGNPFTGGTNQWYNQYGEALGTTSAIENSTHFINLKPNTTYKFFIHGYSNISTIQIIYLDDNNNIGTYANYSISTNVATFTTTKYTKIYIRGKATSSTDNTYFIGQLQTGDATDYEPYTWQTYPLNLGNLEMASIPNTNYKDIFVKEGETWYKREAVGKIVLDGTETGWQYDSTYKYFRNSNYNYGDKIPASVVSGLKQIASHFTLIPTWNVFRDGTTTNGFYYLANNGYKLAMRNTSITTLAQWTTWLGTEKPNFYYPLEETTDIEVNETLADQLEAIKNAVSYSGQTNVSQTNNDMPFVLDLSALKENSDHLVIDNIGNIYSKPTLDLEGTGIVDIYLNDTQMFEVDLSEKNEIVIDTEKMEAYNPTDNTLANRQVTGDYSKFKLDSGENDLRFSGNLTKATITRYERWL